MSQPCHSRRSVLRMGVAAAVAGAVTSPSHAAEVIPLRGVPSRKPVSFKSDGQTCYGFVHAPATAALGRSPGVLMIHDLVDSAAGPHRMFVPLADALANVGFTSLRFDLRGRGDSDGDSIDITPRRDLEDARNAIELLRGQQNLDATNLTLIGHGYGGALAAMNADASGVKKIVLMAAAPGDREARKVPPIKEYEGGRKA